MTPQQKQQFDDLKKQLSALGADTTAWDAQLQAAGTSVNKIANLLIQMQGSYTALNRAANGFNQSLSDSLDLAKAIVDELKKQEGPIVRAKKAMSGLVSIGQQLVDEERELNAIGEKRLKDLAREASTKLKNFQTEALNIAGKLSIQNKITKVEQDAMHIAQMRSRQDSVALRVLAQKKADELNILNGYVLQDKAYRAIQAAAEKRYNLEKETTKTFGLTGAALSAASSIASKFGMSHVQDQVEEINLKLREEMRKEIELNNHKALGFGQRFQFAGKAIGQTIGVLAKGMIDPLFIMGKIYTAFLDVNVAAVEYGRLTGKNGVNTAAMNSSLASSVDVLKVMAETTKEIGLDSASVFSEQDLGRLAEAKNLLGLSDKQASNLGTRSKVAGIGIRDYEKGIVGATNKYNTLNRSTIGHGLVLQEVLNTTDSISLSLAGDPAKISAAASAALALGLNLKRVDDIAGSLTEFQSSISNELEAELLTGKQLNLEKAREYALSNDLAGLAKELSANGASAAEFSSMNRIQQESLAKALGMSRDELAKSIQLEALRKGLGKDAVEAAGDMTLAQVEQLDIQTRLKISLDKLAQAFSPILQAIIPIAEALASVILPIASVIGHISSGLSVLIKPLLFVYGIYKGIQAVMVASLAIGRANYALKALQMGQEAFITREKGTQGLMDKQSLASRVLYNTALLYQLIKEEGIAGIKTFANTLDDKSIAKKIIIGAYNLAEQAYMLVKSGFSIADVGANAAVAVSKGVAATATAGQLASMPALITAQGALATETALTAGAAVVAAEAMTVGIGTVAIIAGIAAVLAAAGTYMMMKDGVIDPKKGPVVSGEFGSVQLHPNDQIVAGTDLMGKKSGQSISTAAAGNDTYSEMKQMREENKSLLTALLNKTGNVYMDSNKVGKAQVLGSYKSA